MARQAKIWWDEQKKQWSVWRCGKRERLGKNKNEAQQLFYKLKAKPKVSIRPDPVMAMFDLFLDWCQRNREERTYEFYLERLQAFSRTIPDLQVGELKPHHVQE